jgi:hypothetical protein
LFFNPNGYLPNEGNLSSGRVGIVTMANANLHAAIVIGIRYSAARKQFGPETGNAEMSVIEYETQKCRLIPFLAASFAMHHFANSLGTDMVKFFMARMSKEGRMKKKYFLRKMSKMIYMSPNNVKNIDLCGLLYQHNEKRNNRFKPIVSSLMTKFEKNKIISSHDSMSQNKAI